MRKSILSVWTSIVIASFSSLSVLAATQAPSEALQETAPSPSTEYLTHVDPPPQAVAWISEVAQDVDAIQYSNKLAELYYAVGYTPIWQDDMASERLYSLLTTLSLAQLSPDFSHRLRLLKEHQKQGDWRAYDVLATDTLLSYLSYLDGVSEFGDQWLFGEGIEVNLPLPSQSYQDGLLNALERRQLYYFLDALTPNSEEHTTMMQEIVRLQDVEKQWPRLKSRRLVRPGGYLRQANKIIDILEYVGDLPPQKARLLRNRKTQHLSRTLVKAVKLFQERHGLNPDGVLGPKTYAWLTLNASDRIRLLALNSERLRLWEVNGDSALIVNIPNYKLNLWIDNKLVLNSKVIVGKPTRQTPMMNTEVKSVVFNPYWNVPSSITRKDILPKMKRDRGYLSRNNFKVLRSWGSSEQIPISAINWHRVSSKSFPYRLQQKPGRRNALGRFKFIIPNKNAIYLHDTPSKRLFNKSTRAFSSGCIRVQQAEKLASILLQNSGVSDKRLRSLKSR